MLETLSFTNICSTSAFCCILKIVLGQRTHKQYSIPVGVDLINVFLQIAVVSFFSTIWKKVYYKAPNLRWQLYSWNVMNDCINAMFVKRLWSWEEVVDIESKVQSLCWLCCESAKLTEQSSIEEAVFRSKRTCVWWYWSSTYVDSDSATWLLQCVRAWVSAWVREAACCIVGTGAPHPAHRGPPNLWQEDHLHHQHHVLNL